MIKILSINVLIAEDSAYQRKVISEMLSEHESIHVIDVAKNGEEAIELVKKHQPDVLLLDLLMPRMDGLTAFKHIIENHPLPTIIFSVLDPNKLDNSIQALLLGAFDYIIKPGGLWKVELPKFKDQLINKVLLAYESKISSLNSKLKFKVERAILEYDKVKGLAIERALAEGTPSESQEIVEKTPLYSDVEISSKIIVIGTSVGGPKTLRSILRKVPRDFPVPILIVQHLDSFFMQQLAQSLDDLCEIKVKIAVNEELIQARTIYLSPGSHHMEVVKKGNRPYIRIFKGEAVNYCIPSVDVLFFSTAQIYGSNAMGIILTGLGEDGVAGLAAIKLAGGRTIAESQETSVVYGMPKVAAENGAANIIVPNYEVINYIMSFSNSTIKSKMKHRNIQKVS